MRTAQVHNRFLSYPAHPRSSRSASESGNALQSNAPLHCTWPFHQSQHGRIWIEYGTRTVPLMKVRGFHTRFVFRSRMAPSSSVRAVVPLDEATSVLARVPGIVAFSSASLAKLALLFFRLGNAFMVSAVPNQAAGSQLVREGYFTQRSFVAGRLS